MSSSRIIKSSKTDLAAMEPFAFQSINRGIPALRPQASASEFVPLGLFDPSESGRTSAQTEQAPEPEGLFLTEEDLDSRLRESFNSGLQEGKNLAERGLVNVFKALRGASDQILSVREKVLRESEDEVLNLIMLIARRVIVREIKQDRTILSAVVHKALAGVTEQDEITVRLNPDDYAMIIAGRDDILNKNLISQRMSLKSDPTVAPGCCQVDTEMGTIDAGLDAQLEEIYRQMLEERTVSTDVHQ